MVKSVVDLVQGFGRAEICIALCLQPGAIKPIQVLGVAKLPLYLREMLQSGVASVSTSSSRSSLLAAKTSSSTSLKIVFWWCT